ncbi:uncharacterized protein LOC127277662 [Leptopilina boulardi]|uniref:uncharacterized protein LOC127277662 n=1 Tax=Leptopilina boulardi TaxID=63433 RepID=UPI0021F687E0|nr:uncharacterized protein LOC127277662 [Leptopilina boulardi]
MDSIEVLEKQFTFPKQDNTKVNEQKMHTKGRIGKLCTGIKQRYNEILEDREFQEYIEKVVEFFKTNPFLAWGSLAVLLGGIAFPIITFVLFIIASVAFVVTGFIILEVTIFIIGATVMSCSVFFVATTVGIILLSLLTVYLVFCYLIMLLKKRKT